MSQLLNKTKDFVKSTKYYFRYVNKGSNSVGDEFARKSCCI